MVDLIHDYAVVIIHYKAPDLVARLLKSIREQSLPPSKVVIVDNSEDLCTDAVAAVAGSLAYEVIGLPNPGYAAAVNRARQAVADDVEYLLVLTQEVTLDPALAASMMHVMKHRSTAACLGPALYRSSASTEIFSFGGRLGFGGETVHLKKPKADVPYPVDWIDGAVMFIRLAAFDSLAGFDERYFLYFEEVDFAFRLRSRGMTVLVDPNVIAYQEPGNYIAYLRFRNHLLFARQRYPRLEVCGALMIKLMRSIPGWLKRRQFSAPAWGLRGTVDGLQQRGGQPPARLFARTAWAEGANS